MYSKCFNKLELKLELLTNQAAKTGGQERVFLVVSWHPLFLLFIVLRMCTHTGQCLELFLWEKGLHNDAENT